MASTTDADASGELLRQFDAFLQEYGYMSANGTDFSQTPWIENPTAIWRAIGSAARRPESPDPIASRESVSQIRERAHQTVRARLKGLERWWFDRLLASTIAYVDLRERTSLHISQDSFQMRRLFLALGQHLIARGELERPDDIFYLNLEELYPLFAASPESGRPDASGQESARERVAARRAEMEQDARLELPDTFCGPDAASHLGGASGGPDASSGGDQLPACFLWAEAPAEVLVGIAGSSGRVEGRARIVVDPAQTVLLPPDASSGQVSGYDRQDILVVPFTDVSWTPLFMGIGGLIAETGGQLSHSAIIAREYGLPAVVNVKNATRLIREGQTVIVDGTQGKVYLHPDPFRQTGCFIRQGEHP